MRKVISVLLLTALLFLSIPFVLNAQEGTSVITSAEIDRENKDVKLNIRAEISENHRAIVASTEGSYLYLFMLSPYEKDDEINKKEPLSRQGVSGRMQYTVDFNAESEMLFARYVLAYKRADGVYIKITDGKYIDNPELFAESTYVYPETKSKKGLMIQYYSDAQELGISHTIINVPINKIVVASSGSDVFQFVYQGENYYADGDTLSYLDYKIKTLTAAGVHCYINFILTAPERNMSDGVENLYFTSDFKTGAALYGINVLNKSGANYFEAIVDFLAKRYTRADRQYGFVGSYILGYKVNDSRSFNYTGLNNFEQNVEAYTAAFRIMYTAVISNYSNAKMFISLGGNYNTIAQDAIGTILDANIDYSMRAYLDRFGELMKKSGDIPYGITLSAFASDVKNTEILKDDLATDELDTPYISIKNIELFVDILSGEKYLYNGKIRPLMISPFGINGLEAENLQAANYVYSYLKVESIPQIESIIYFRQMDNLTDSGEFGLWHVDEETGTIDRQKKIYEVFKNIDTENRDESLEFALSVLQLTSWKDALNTDLKTSQKKVYSGRGIIRANPESNKDSIIKFTQSNLAGFEPFDNADFVEYKNDENYGGMLNVKLCKENELGEYGGAGVVFDRGIKMKGASKITVSLMPYSDIPGVRFDMMLRLYSFDGSCVYEGTYENFDTELNTIEFDISDFVSSSETLDTIKIWVKQRKTEDVEIADIGYCLSGIYITEGGVSIMFQVIRIMSIILLIVAVLALFVVLIRGRILQKKRIEMERKKDPFRDKSGRMVKEGMTRRVRR